MSTASTAAPACGAPEASAAAAVVSLMPSVARLAVARDEEAGDDADVCRDEHRALPPARLAVGDHCPDEHRGARHRTELDPPEAQREGVRECEREEHHHRDDEQCDLRA